MLFFFFFFAVQIFFRFTVILSFCCRVPDVVLRVEERILISQSLSCLAIFVVQRRALLKSVAETKAECGRGTRRLERVAEMKRTALSVRECG